MLKRRKYLVAILCGIIVVLGFIAILGMQKLRLDLASLLYDSGVTYKALGWPGNARAALDAAEFFGRGAPIAVSAKRFRDTKLPAHPVTDEAVEMNIRGYNANQSGNKALARQIFSECLRRYPGFEWPYNNFLSLCIAEGKYAEAEKYGQQAVTINPKYVNALINMAILKDTQHDFKSARDYLDRALEADPTDPGAIQMNARLTFEEQRINEQEQEPKQNYTGQ